VKANYGYDGVFSSLLTGGITGVVTWTGKKDDMRFSYLDFSSFSY